jgi:hypothetical protein
MLDVSDLGQILAIGLLDEAGSMSSP